MRPFMDLGHGAANTAFVKRRALPASAYRQDVRDALRIDLNIGHKFKAISEKLLDGLTSPSRIM